MEYKCVSSLLLAIEYGDELIVGTLLEMTMDVNSKESRLGRTPLHAAVEHDRHEIARMLLEREASVDEASDDDLTALHIAVANRSRRMVELLLEHGADVNPRRKFRGKTPLYLAVENNCPGIAKLLLQDGASIEESTIGDTTVVDVARRIGDEQLAALLLEHAGEPVQVLQMLLRNGRVCRDAKMRMRVGRSMQARRANKKKDTLLVKLLKRNTMASVNVKLLMKKIIR